MSYSGWFGHCPKCGCEKGTYKVIPKDDNRYVETNEVKPIELIEYECKECGWIGNFNEILSKEQWINNQRFEKLKDILQ
jgi:hypothetical protein